MKSSGSYYYQQKFRNSSNSDEYEKKLRDDRSTILDALANGDNINMSSSRKQKAIHSMSPEEKAEYQFFLKRNRRHKPVSSEPVSKERFLELMMKRITK